MDKKSALVVLLAFLVVLVSGRSLPDDAEDPTLDEETVGTPIPDRSAIKLTEKFCKLVRKKFSGIVKMTRVNFG